MEKLNDDLLLQPKQHYYQYYEVKHHETAITAFSVNDFRPRKNAPATALPVVFTLLPGWNKADVFTDIGQAMEKAKATTLAAINNLLKGGETTLPQLLQYRMDHYEDLNVNLVDANVQKMENEMKSRLNFKWKPYLIPLPS